MTSPDSPSPAIAPLVAQIKSGTAVDREQAAAALWSLAWNDANRVAIAEYLVTLVTHGAAGGQEQAARALGNLAYDNAANQAAIAAAGAIDPLVALVTNGAAGGQEQAARALNFLARGNAANQAAIREAGGIPPLVALVTNDAARTCHPTWATRGRWGTSPGTTPPTGTRSVRPAPSRRSWHS